MKLRTDARGCLAGDGLFRPNTLFDAQPQPDGSVRVRELAEVEVAIVKPRLVGGKLRGADVGLNRDALTAAIREERDAR